MPLNPNDQTLLAGVQMTQSFSSPAIVLVRNNAFSFQATWTGSPVGTWVLESSCDSAENPLTQLPVNFDPIITNPAGGSAGTLSISWSIPISFNWVRVSYVFASGSGLLQSLTFNGR